MRASCGLADCRRRECAARLRVFASWRRWPLAPMTLVAQEATFHVDVKLVNIFVNVTDKNGVIVGGLTKDDFAVFEDNRPQQIAVFERKTDVPLNLTLAIDTSGSVRKDLDEEANAARHFAHDILADAGPDERDRVCDGRDRADSVYQ